MKGYIHYSSALYQHDDHELDVHTWIAHKIGKPPGPINDGYNWSVWRRSIGIILRSDNGETPEDSCRGSTPSGKSIRSCSAQFGANKWARERKQSETSMISRLVWWCDATLAAIRRWLLLAVFIVRLRRIFCNPKNEINFLCLLEWRSNTASFAIGCSPPYSNLRKNDRKLSAQ